MAASVGCTSAHQKGPANIINNSSFRSELLEVAHHLKNEKSFVGNEKENIKKLYSLVDNSSMKVHQLNMSVHQQRCLLNDLITGSCRVTPQICCSRFNSLSKANFIDGYKFLTHHELRVGRFLKSFRGNPKLVALCISELESSKEACCVEHFVRVVMLQLYEGLINHEDEVLAGRMLQHLFLFQIQKHSTNSLKHFLKSETAFNIAYRLYTECLSSSKTFLTAAFHSPTISLLSEDEWYFDVDVSSCIARLGPAEALRRFGQASSEDYDVKVKVHHTRLMDKLVYFTKLFIESLKSCHSIFPKSLARIFKNIYKVFSNVALSQHPQQQQQDGNHNEANWDAGDNNVFTNGACNSNFSSDCNENDIKKALLDMVLNSFICLAICDPQFGGVVSDTPISEVSRHNLRQIAHIIQNLCLSTVDDVDVPACELYDKFDKDCLSFLLDMITRIEDDSDDDEDDEEEDGEVVCRDDNDSPQRSSLMMIPSDLLQMIELVYSTSLSDDCQQHEQQQNTQYEQHQQREQQQQRQQHSKHKQQHKQLQRRLHQLIVDSNLPPVSALKTCYKQFLDSTQEKHTNNNNINRNNNNTLTSSLPTPSSSTSAGNRKKRPVDKRTSGAVPLFPATPPSQPDSNDDKNHHQQHQHHHHDNNFNYFVIISFGIYNECPGMLPENKILEESLKQGRISSNKPSEDNDDNDRHQRHHHHHQEAHDKDNAANTTVSEKRTRFSLSHDHDSAEPSSSNNNNNNNEGASEEAVSSHSTDNDDNNSNDNLSDMAYSANLSGHNTPSLVSGRDTPVSLISGAPELVGGGVDDGDGDRPMENIAVSLNVGSGDNAANIGNNPGENIMASVRHNPGASGDNLASNAVGISMGGVGRGGVGIVLMTTGRRRRDDVTDKFGKFDIKQDLEYEAKSTVSDTWSTDVLASDSEPPPEQNQLDRLEEVVEERGVVRVFPSAANAGIFTAEASETASDAWSTDVLASDTSERQADRLLELDQDDVCSLSGRSNYSTSSLLRLQQQQQHQDVFLDNMPLNLGAVLPQVTTSYAAHRSHVDDLTLKGSYRRREAQAVSQRDECHRKEHSSEDGSGFNNSFEQDVFINNNSNNTQNNVGFNNRQHIQSNFDNLETFFNTPNMVVKNATITSATSATPNDPFSIFDPLSSFSNGELRCGVEASKMSSTSADNLNMLLTDLNKDINNNCHNSINNNMTGSITDVTSNNNINSSSGSNHNHSMMSTRSSSSMTHLQNFFIASESNLAVTNLSNSNSSLNSSSLTPNKIVDEKKKKSGIFGHFKEKLTKMNSSNKRKVLGDGSECSSHRAPSSSILIDFNQESSNNNNSTNIDYDTILEKYRKSPQQPQVSLMQAASTSSTTTTNNDCNTNGMRLTTHQQTSLLSLPTTSSSSPSPLAHSSNWEKSFPDSIDHHHHPRHHHHHGGASPNHMNGNKDGVIDRFVEAKTKLRLVLSKVDCEQFRLSTMAVKSQAEMKKDETADNELMIFLKYLLSEALVVGDKILATQLQATIKCLSNFRHYDLKRVLNSLRADYKLRSCYVAYLTRCKRSLLAFNHKYEKLLAELTRDQEMLNKYMISMMTRLFLEKHQRVLLKFVVDFQSLVLFDEKSDLLERFLTAKHAAMRQDVMWKDATEPQLQEARLCMERMIMSHIYLYAMYPNGDGDTSRDRLLEEHMQKLSAVITPDHRDLRIPSIYQNECPWLAAQKELIMINAFKTPEDKLGCVARCCSTIMTLLSLSLTCNTANVYAITSSNKSVATTSTNKVKHSAVPVADDLVPVLLYVIIQSGTPNLLSTIQYIESYCCKNNDSASFAADGCYKNAKIDGEVWYWWTQFVAAVNFIKSMDYKE